MKVKPIITSNTGKVTATFFLICVAGSMNQFDSNDVVQCLNPLLAIYR